jgi:hypothetical protein
MGFCRRMISDIWRLVIRTMLPLALNTILLRWRPITGSMLPRVAAESTLLHESQRDNMHTGRHDNGARCCPNVSKSKYQKRNVCDTLLVRSDGSLLSRVMGPDGGRGGGKQLLTRSAAGITSTGCPSLSGCSSRPVPISVGAACHYCQRRKARPTGADGPERAVYGPRTGPDKCYAFCNDNVDIGDLPNGLVPLAPVLA